MPPVLELLARTKTPRRVTTYGENTEREPLPIALKECLSIELEVDAKTARFNVLAAWRPDTGEQLTARNGPPDASSLTRALANRYRELGACPRIRFWRRKAPLSNLIGE